MVVGGTENPAIADAVQPAEAAARSHVSGARYVWESKFRPDAIATLPDWFFEVTAATKPRVKTHITVGGTIPEGERNNTITHLTGRLLRGYIPAALTLDLVLAYNAVHCSPPLDDDEVEAIVNSIAGRELRRRGAA